MKSSTQSSAAISKTAFDALQAKYSAVILAGYEPLLRNEKAKDRYVELLQRMAEQCQKTGMKRRQTPLVNLGYAFRISSILFQIESFFYFHKHCEMQCVKSERSTNKPCIQIVILGAGLDVTGLWCLTYIEELRRFIPDININVIEIDTEDISEVKKQALLGMNILKKTDEETSDTSILLRGNFCEHGDSKPEKSSIYTLVACDLRNTKGLEGKFLASSSLNFDSSVPTLVISELVLAYLTTTEQDNLLKWCAKSLCKQSASGLVFYEPLGPQNKASPSVLGGYQNSYYRQFQAKLERGQADKLQERKTAVMTSDNDSSIPFSPVGDSCDNVAARLRNSIGFDKVSSTIAGEACFSQQEQRVWAAKEVFDEHAALALHLSSYTLTTALGSEVVGCEIRNTDGKKRHFHDILFEQFMCPWLPGIIPKWYQLKKETKIKESKFCCLMSIQKSDERQIRNLFSGAYQHLSATYISVRKMVKTALRKDLGSSSEMNSHGAPEIQNNETEGNISAIGYGYRQQGGDFLVATQLRKKSIDADQDLNQYEKIILGGIGIRRCPPAQEYALLEAVTNEDKCHICCFEINRLLVDTSFHRNGIGSILMDAATDLAINKIRRKFGQWGSWKIMLVAITPAMLESANCFYKSKGFSIHEEGTAGELSMRTYSKIIEIKN